MTEAIKEPELIYPVSQSKSGRNAHYYYCDARQHQVSYAVCLNTMEAYDAGLLKKDQVTDCQRFMCRDECPARGMRAQEIAADRALFFTPRPAHITDPAPKQELMGDMAKSTGKYDLNNESYARGWAQVGQRLNRDDSPKPTRNIGPITKPKAQPGFVQMDGAAIVNQIAKEDQAKKAASPAPSPQPQPEVKAAPVEQTSLKPLPGESPLAFVQRRNKLKAEGKL